MIIFKFYYLRVREEIHFVLISDNYEYIYISYDTTYLMKTVFL